MDDNAADTVVTNVVTGKPNGAASRNTEDMVADGKVPGEIRTVSSFVQHNGLDYVRSVIGAKGYHATYRYDFDTDSEKPGNLVDVYMPGIEYYQRESGVFVPYITKDFGETGAVPVMHFTYDVHGQIDTITTAEGMVTKFEYYLDSDAQLQRRGRIKQLIIDYGSAPHKNIITEYDYNYVFNADYNAMMYVNTVTQDKGDTTKLNITAQTLYNNLVQLIECIHPVLDGQAVGYKTKYDYTKNGKLWKAKRNFTDGQSTTRTQIVEYSYNLLDNLNTFTDSLGRVTTTNYDNNENVINIVDPKGAINNYWTDIAYDFRDLMEKTTDAEGNETTYAYDANGNLKSIKDAKNQTTTYDYDSYDRLILTTYADNTSTEQYAYDSDGDGITRNTSRTGDKFYSDYDGMGRLIRKIIDKASVTPHVVIVDNTSSAANWSLEDNANGKYGNDCLVTKTVDAFHTFEVTSVNLSSGDYQVYMRWPDIATANSVSVEVLDGMATLATLTINQAQKQGQWNLLGNYIISGSNTVSVKITAQGSSTVTCADAIRLVPTILPQTKYYYDISGKVLQIAQDSSTIDYEYDTLGRLNKTTDQNTNIVRYDYDNLGRRTQLVYPDESSIAYVYDKMNRLTDIIDDFSENVIVHYDYDELSRRKALYYNYDGDGDYDETGVDGIISYDYEDMVEANNDNLGNRLESVKHDINNDATYDLTYAYTYDTVGNCETKIIDGTETHSYLYDNIYQITQDQKTGGDKYNWVYDVVGSWDELKLNDVTQTDFCSWNNDDTVNNLLNQYGSVGPSGARVDYDYDSNGNLTSDGTYAYVYDPQNRLTDIYNGITLMVSYSYDARGRRISKTIYSPSTLMTKYCYDGDQVIAEYDGSDTLLRKYIYGPGIDEPICMIRYIAGVEDGRYFYHQDALGSVAALSQFDSGSASFVETYRYTAFGQTIICDGSGNPRTSNHSAYDNPCMFTGREYETLDGNNLKLYYYRARFYKPEIGRFLQTDPIGYTDNMNLYQYCGNNSINLVDPMGLCKEGYGYGASWSAFWSTIENRLSNIHNFWCGGNAWNNLGNWTIDFLGNVYDFEVMLKDSLYDIGENPAIVYNTLYEFGFHSNEIYLNDIANKTDAELCAMVANLTFDFETAVVTTSAAQKLSSLRLIKKPAGPRVGVCFTADTEVLTPNGEIEICQIQPGDEVWGYNFATGQTEICHVTRVFERTTGCITIISVGSETIETTPEHPFWICDVGWKLAGQLNVGDLLYGIDGSGLPVLNVTQKDEQATVYNFEVENAHTYYVSQESILVHNNPCAEPFGPIDLTKGGAKKIRNLTNMKDMKAADAIRARGGGASQINQLQTGYEKLTVGDLANKAAAGDRAAETAIKIIKQASKKAQKY